MPGKKKHDLESLKQVSKELSSSETEIDSGAETENYTTRHSPDRELSYNGSRLEGSKTKISTGFSQESKKPDHRIDSDSLETPEYDKMARRVMETEYILDNLDEAVQDEELLSDGSLSSVVERALVYEEDGELTKDTDVIESSDYSERLDKKADKLIENGVNGRKKVEEMVEQSKNAVDSYEDKAAGSVYGESILVDNSDLADWVSDRRPF